MTEPATTLKELAGSYAPGSEAWMLNREATLLLGAGPRALLLQIAHPLVAEGVDQHSDFQRDPWGRLRRTLRSYLGIIYGSPARQRVEIKRLNRLHERVSGPVRDPLARRIGGKRYRARDPELSLWVHATLVESTISVFEAWIAPLDRERKERFYAETRAFARALGIPKTILPPDLAAFEAYWATTLSDDGPIVVTDTARRLANAILHPPLGPIPATVYDWTTWPALALLPERIRRDYGIAWGPLQVAVAAWLVSGYRAWRPLFPTSLRWMPQALEADRREAARQPATKRRLADRRAVTLRKPTSGGGPDAAVAQGS